MTLSDLDQRTTPTQAISALAKLLINLVSCM